MNAYVGYLEIFMASKDHKGRVSEFWRKNRPIRTLKRLERAILDISYDIMGSLENGISSSLIMLGGGAISLISKAMSSKSQDNYLKSEYDVGYNFSLTDLRSRYNDPKPYPEYKNIADIIAIIYLNDTNQYVPFDKIYNLALLKSKGEITDVQIEIILSIDRAILQERDMRERMKLKVKRERLMRGFKTPLWKEFYKRLEKKYPKQKN